MIQWNSRSQRPQSQHNLRWSDLEYYSIQKWALHGVFIFVWTFHLQRDKSIWVHQVPYCHVIPEMNASHACWHIPFATVSARMSRDAEMALSKQKPFTDSCWASLYYTYSRHRFFSISSLFHFFGFFFRPQRFHARHLSNNNNNFLVRFNPLSPFLSIFSCSSASPLSPSLSLSACLFLFAEPYAHIFKLNRTHHMHPVVFKTIFIPSSAGIHCRSFVFNVCSSSASRT